MADIKEIERAIEITKRHICALEDDLLKLRLQEYIDVYILNIEVRELSIQALEQMAEREKRQDVGIDGICHNLGKRYKDLRIEAGYKKQSDFANMPGGLYAPKISELENGNRSMTLTELKFYHKIFNVSYEYLLGESNDRAVNIEKEAICAKLGLSESAVTSLIEMRNHKYNLWDRNDLLKTIDFLISNTQLVKIINKYFKLGRMPKNNYYITADGNIRQTAVIYTDFVNISTDDLLNSLLISIQQQLIDDRKHLTDINVGNITESEET